MPALTAPHGRPRRPLGAAPGPPHTEGRGSGSRASPITSPGSPTPSSSSPAPAPAAQAHRPPAGRRAGLTQPAPQEPGPERATKLSLHRPWASGDLPATPKAPLLHPEPSCAPQPSPGPLSAPPPTPPPASVSAKRFSLLPAQSPRPVWPPGDLLLPTAGHGALRPGPGHVHPGMHVTERCRGWEVAVCVCVYMCTGRRGGDRRRYPAAPDPRECQRTLRWPSPSPPDTSNAS